MIKLSLPGGYFDDDGRCEQEAVLRPLCGKDEEWLINLDRYVPAITLTISLLERCLLQLGTSQQPSRELVGRLLVVDKDFLLLQLLKLTFGSRVGAVLSCDSPDCAEKIDIDFNIDDIQVEDPGIHTVTSNFFLQEKKNGKKIEVAFRQLTLRDLEWIATENLSAKQHDDSVLRLLSRCLLPSDGRFESKSAWAENLDAHQIAQIETEIVKRSAYIDLTFEVTCPECRYRFPACFDPLGFLLHKLSARIEQLYREIHTLAFWYHWSEAEILAMRREKRWRYLHLISEEFSKNTPVEA